MTSTAPLDEMVDGRGGLRPQWRGLLGTLGSLGHEEMAERGQLLSRAFLEEAATGLSPAITSSAWRSDPIPLPIQAEEFAAIEAGLAQRARLLEALLQDVYGPQRLLSDGVLPPSLVYANPAFLRACQAPPPAQRGQLISFYAADLVRGPDGRWRVLADRTARANGVAYALENRRVLSRVLPELFSGREVQHLHPFFEIWQDALQRLAPESDRTPGLALLSPGPRDPMWSEHVILARELSCELVEDGDLTVRDGALHLKTLRGLRQIDVLLRRQDGRTLDPLELEHGPGQGVAGLLDAARSGAVRITNDPGAGFAEAPALAAFLPDLAERLLGEKLLLPRVRTLWLGDAATRERVGADLSGWLVRPALDSFVAPVQVEALSAGERERLGRQLERTPWDLSLIANIDPSVAPCAGPEGIVPKPVVLRVFLVFDGTEWRALQGGLARALEAGEGVHLAQLPRHALSKDVWVTVEDRAEIIGPRSLALPVLAIRRGNGDLPSRVADDFFWLGRYLERLESAGRRLRTLISRLGQLNPSPRAAAELRALANLLGESGLLNREQVSGPGTTSLLRALPGIVREGGALPRQLARIGRLTELLRDRLTAEMHAAINQGLRDLGEQFRGLGSIREPGKSLEPISRAMAGLLHFGATVSGLTAENMVRSGGRLFLDLGRRVERAQAITVDLACALDQPDAALPGRMEAALRLMLELCDSVITYRSRYLTVLQPAPVLDLLLADEGNPRGLAHQLIAVRDALETLAQPGETMRLPPQAEALLDETLAIVQSVADRSAQGEAAARLPARLRRLGDDTAALSDAIMRRYFVLLPPPRAVGVEGDLAELRGAA